MAQAPLDAEVRPSTKKVYASRIKIFSEYCRNEGVNPQTCATVVVVNFLAMLAANKNLAYQTVCG